jgi:L-ribulose-5-phosphate 3-epimerase
MVHSQKGSNMQAVSNLCIGLNGRFFPNNWRPALDEVAFAQMHEFGAIQFPGKVEGLGTDHLGADLETVGAALQAAKVMAVMEILVRVDAEGKTEQGQTLLEVLHANIDALWRLRCQYVHWHAVPREPMDEHAIARLEISLLHVFKEGVVVAGDHGFRLGFEHNEPALGLFGTPAACANALEQVPGLSLVWDINHTTPQQMPGFKAVIDRVGMLHVSDTPLPEVNHHLPLGMGTIDYGAVCCTLRERGWSGPTILEIGGLPKSGGYNRDTDQALIDSRRRLTLANAVP